MTEIDATNAGITLPDTVFEKKLKKLQWQRDLNLRGYERNTMSPELSEALRTEIRTALDAGGGPFDVNVARRVYDLAIAARDMCIAASSTVKDAIDQIKDTNGPMETLDSPDTPESAAQVSESFGARMIRELLAVVPSLGRSGGQDPRELVHALAEARSRGMHDVAAELEKKLFGRELTGPRPVVDVSDFDHGLADGKANAVPIFLDVPEYARGYKEGTLARYLAEARSRGMHDVAAELEKKLFGRELTGPRPVVDVSDFDHGLADGKANAVPIVLDVPEYARGYKEGTLARYLEPARIEPAVSGQSEDAVSVPLGSYEHGFADGKAGARFAAVGPPEYERGYDEGVRARFLNDPMPDPRVTDPPLCEACKKDPDPRGASACHDCREIARVAGDWEKARAREAARAAAEAQFARNCREVLKPCDCPARDDDRDGMHHDQECPRFDRVALSAAEIARMPPDTQDRYARNALSMIAKAAGRTT